MYLRTLNSDEVSLHKELRLRALQEAPNSFGDTLADVKNKPLSYWHELTGSVTKPDGNVMFLVCDGKQVLGSAYGLFDRDNNEVCRVGGMWVEPFYRRKGFGRALIDAIVEWAGGHELKSLRLWAPAHSLAAIGLYQQAGFRKTGLRRPFPSHPNMEIIELVLKL